eukprot:446502-Prorocentrum_minimum.AAC.1
MSILQCNIHVGSTVSVSSPKGSLEKLKGIANLVSARARWFFPPELLSARSSMLSEPGAMEGEETDPQPQPQPKSKPRQRGAPAGHVTRVGRAALYGDTAYTPGNPLPSRQVTRVGRAALYGDTAYTPGSPPPPRNRFATRFVASSRDYCIQAIQCLFFMIVIRCAEQHMQAQAMAAEQLQREMERRGLGNS